MSQGLKAGHSWQGGFTARAGPEGFAQAKPEETGSAEKASRRNPTAIARPGTA